jgi:hypothetical protein
VDDSGDGAEVDQAVQGLPAFAAHFSDGPLGRGQGQWDHQCETGHTGGDEPALDHVGQHVVDVETLVGPHPGHQVKRAVEKGEQAEHAAQSDQPILARQLAQRRDREGDQQENQGAVAGAVGDGFNGISTEVLMESVPDQQGQRDEAGKENRGFEVAQHG